MTFPLATTILFLIEFATLRFQTTAPFVALNATTIPVPRFSSSVVPTNTLPSDTTGVQNRMGAGSFRSHTAPTREVCHVRDGWRP